MKGSGRKLLQDPIVHPGNAARRNSKSCLAECCTGRSLKIPESTTSRIGECKMGEREFNNTETRCIRGFLSRENPLPKKCQLKTEVIPVGAGKRAGRIPPLGLEGTMWPVVAGKLVHPPRFGRTPCNFAGIVLGLRKGNDCPVQVKET
jgi:hypothetical protein